MSRQASAESAGATAHGLGENRRAVARVNLAAIERNVARMRRELKDDTSFCAVVKADGYGHGALPAARAALAGGADWLAVAGAQEAAQLRQAGIADVPLLVMGALSDSERGEALAAGADVVVWHEQQVHEIAAAGGGRVHVKLDTGMGRLGTRDPAEATRALEAAHAAAGVEAVGVMTHFATADERDGGHFERQLDLFTSWVSEVKARWPTLIAHAANSAAALREPASHFDMVRCGIGIYGMDPFGSDPDQVGLEPALELLSYVAEVKDCRSGQSAGYGRRFIAEQDTRLAVLPIGYGDGWRRGLSAGLADVLIEGRRRPLVGTVSMDNVTVELGPAAASGNGSDGSPAADGPLGAQAVLIGAQGAERITAEEVARRLQTINYEITCALTPRVLRVHHRDGQPAGQ
jgi:alanine racemase